MLKRFCGILLGGEESSALFFEPLPEDYKDLQKLIWTFIQSFRRETAARYSQGTEVI